MSRNTCVIAKKFRALSHCLGERALRLWAAVEAQSLGRGGVSDVARATKLSRTTIHAGLKELETPQRRAQGAERSRLPGGGRKPLVRKDPQLLGDLEGLVEPTTRGDPESPLRWSCKSTTRLAEELNRSVHRVSQRTVCDLLADLGYSLQSTHKTREGAQHPDRDAQFHHIAQEVQRFQRQGEPVISVDTKKKEMVGDFENKGQEWRPLGEPAEVRVHDFMDKKLGKVAPYGVYEPKRQNRH